MHRELLPWRVRKLCNDIYRSAATLAIQARSGVSSTFGGDAPEASRAGAKVSILVPTLARGPHAGRLVTLETLLRDHLPAQTHQDYEVMVYCDGRNLAVEAMIARLEDPRIRVLWTEEGESAWGHPQTRLGIDAACGDYFVRINDDNKPYRDYLSTLIRGLADGSGVSYARVVFKGEARQQYSYLLRGSYVLPRDRHGVLANGNIDCLCYMTRMELARRYRDRWGDMYAADWRFLEAMLEDGVKACFVDRVIADKC